jgi:phosphohistidine swiveling domain-containing protein
VPSEVPDGFWERDVSHSPKPLTPMLGSVFFAARNAALREMFATFGFLVETLEFREIGGWEYSRLVPLGGHDRGAPPPYLMPVLFRVVPTLRRRIRTCVAAVRDDAAGAMIDRWYAEWQPDLAARAAGLLADDPAALDDAELAEHTQRAYTLLQDGCRRHFLLHGAIAFPLAELVFTLEELLAWTEERTFQLLTGLSVMSTRPAHRLAVIARQLADEPGAMRLFEARTPSLEEVRAVAPAIAEAIEAQIAEFGSRALSYEIAEPSLAELPDLTMRLLADQVRRGYDPEAETAALARARSAAVEAAHAALAGRPDADRERFERALARAQRAYPVREDNEFSTNSVPLALLRRAVLEHGVRLVARGVLAQRDDVFGLTLPQTVAALVGSAVTGGTARAGAEVSDALGSAEVRQLVADARARRAWTEAHPAPASYGRRPGPMPSLDALPSEARFAMRVLLWTVESIFAPESSNREMASAAVSGIPASAGRYTGPVCVVRDEAEFGRIRPGDVLVCPVTSPVWSLVFPSVGALVTDSGGLLSHPAIIAREYRIPAVVATGSATSILRDGQMVTVDGTTGRVEVLG